jgi:hypothetical protein
LEQFLSGGGGLGLLSALLNECHSRGPTADYLALPVLSSIRALLNSTVNTKNKNKKGSIEEGMEKPNLSLSLFDAVQNNLSGNEPI